MSTDLILFPSPEPHPPTLVTPTPKAAKRVMEFFTDQVNNTHTRKAYLNAACRVSEWCQCAGFYSSPKCNRSTLLPS